MNEEKILLSKSDYDKITIVSLGVGRTFSLSFVLLVPSKTNILLENDIHYQDSLQLRVIL